MTGGMEEKTEEKLAALEEQDNGGADKDKPPLFERRTPTPPMKARRTGAQKNQV